MRLTTTIRNAFVRAAMDDVPKQDFREQFRSVAMKHAVASLPPAVRKLWDNPATREWVARVNIHQYSSLSVSVPGFNREILERELGPKEAEFNAMEKSQSDRLQELRRNLAGVANSVSTRKALADALPEFEKYLPADEAAANRSLPVVQNVVADFVKAGWPKGKKA